MDAHRGDIGELRHEMQLGFAKMDERFAKIDERFAKMDERFARVDPVSHCLRAIGPNLTGRP